MQTKIIIYVLIVPVLLALITAFIVRRRNHRRFKRYQKENEQKWRALKQDIARNGSPLSTLGNPPVSNFMPSYGFTIYNASGDRVIWSMSGNVDQVSDLFGSVLRDNKELRDMVKSAFRKANKTLA